MPKKKPAQPPQKKPKKPSAKASPTTTLDLVDLTPDELRRLARPREGFEPFVAKLLALYANEREELAIKSLDAKDIQARFLAYQSLEPFEGSAAKHLEMIQETRALHASKVWSGMLEIYAKAQAAARTNEGVKRGIADFAKFMSLGPRKKPAKKPNGG